VIAVVQAYSVLQMMLLAISVTVGSSQVAFLVGGMFSQLALRDVTSVISAFASILATFFWIVTVLVAVPMIVSAIVASQNRVPCSCSPDLRDGYDKL